MWALTHARLLKGQTVEVTGLVDVGPDGHAFLRTPKNSYLSSEEDVFVPGSLARRYGTRIGKTGQG